MLEHLRFLRTEFKDEIPNKVIHSNDPDNRYKVRRNWFTGVVANAENLLNEGLIIDEEKQTAAEDIQTANNLIDIILGDKP